MRGGEQEPPEGAERSPFRRRREPEEDAPQHEQDERRDRNESPEDENQRFGAGELLAQLPRELRRVLWEEFRPRDDEAEVQEGENEDREERTGVKARHRDARDEAVQDEEDARRDEDPERA